MNIGMFSEYFKQKGKGGSLDKEPPLDVGSEHKTESHK